LVGIIHYFNKVKEYGLYTSCGIVVRKIRNTYNAFYWRSRALSHTAHTSWPIIAQQQKLPQNFAIYWQSFNKSFQCASYILKIIPAECDMWVYSAEEFIQNYHYFLSRATDDDPPWHEQFPSQTFYKDILIKPSATYELSCDVKTAWERSRFQHLVALGNAFVYTSSFKYPCIAIQSMVHWIEHNPYMLGVNWMCPMEVAIRSINWIWALNYYKTVHDISITAWETIITSLYDHMRFLEGNWEIYDGRTNNHYLANLVGYLYLCWLFQSFIGAESKIEWCYSTALAQFDYQLLSDGTFYEGSTYYNSLVAELLHHLIFIAQELHLPVSDQLYTRLDTVINFLDWCTPYAGSLIAIGDNDSGIIIKPGLLKKLSKKNNYGTRHYPDFGVSLYKSKKIHATMRHHSFKKYQPSGHFHNDAGSITLALDGIPVIIDPGSFVYTASIPWRNYFRSAAVHNTMFIKDHEPTPFDGRLFALALPESNSSEYVMRDTYWQTNHTLYKRFGLRMSRSVEFNNNKLILTDSWFDMSAHGEPVEPCSKHISNKNLISMWNFTLGPDIIPIQKDNCWLLYYKDTCLASIESQDIQFTTHPGWYSPEYGTKLPCTHLRAEKPVCINKNYVIILSIF